nr:MAG TPA: hypothetical protein [Caudoviricetes sp.]
MYIHRSEFVKNHLFTPVYICLLIQVCLCFSTSDFVCK